MKKKKETETGIIEITPVQASNWLSHNNKSNRSISERIVDYYLNQMQKGQWKVSTDAIGFDKKNNLLNGQHRLTALVRYNKPLPFLIMRGLDPDTFNVIDTGKLRSPGDILSVHGYTNTNMRAAIMRFIISLSSQSIAEAIRVTKRGYNNQDILDFAQANNEMMDEIMKVALSVQKNFRPLHSRYVGGLYYMFRKLNRAKAAEFFKLYESGSGLDEDNPVHVLRQKLIQNSLAKKKYPERDKIAWAIVAWNNWRKGNKITKIQWYGKNTADIPVPI